MQIRGAIVLDEFGRCRGLSVNNVTPRALAEKYHMMDFPAFVTIVLFYMNFVEQPNYLNTFKLKVG
jgi:hypothetical protein